MARGEASGVCDGRGGRRVLIFFEAAWSLPKDPSKMVGHYPKSRGHGPIFEGSWRLQVAVPWTLKNYPEKKRRGGHQAAGKAKELPSKSAEVTNSFILLVQP